MKTIEERASECALKNAGWNDTLRSGVKSGYVLGATEQKKIDFNTIEEVYNNMRIFSIEGYSGIDGFFKLIKKSMGV